MKAIFLSEKENKLRDVYAPSVVSRLRELTEIDETPYAKRDILSQPEKFSDTQVIFSTWGMPEFTEEEIKTYFPELECVFYAAGTVQKFARPFLSCRVKIFSAWAANAVPVAEYAVAQIILANKGFFTHTRLMAEKRLDDAKAKKADCIGNYGEKVGLIGCGMIGSLVAEMLKSYDLEVCVFDPFLSEEKARTLNVSPVSLDELFASCRVVSNHLANNEATKGMLRYEHFSSMPEYATFINTGRGAQVVEDDLVRTLSERPDLTAVLDVTYPEPAELTHPFYTLENCFMTPHIAGSLGGEVVRMAEYMVKEFESYSSGKPCKYEVSMKMLETMA
ncbi:MAG: hydroxyacid dehydrogenase [Clostridia bacterium]|nr:hydroxyacid dehydrogenase [Clostridia bacterium]